MYLNLEKCMRENGISLRDYAAFLGISERCARDRLLGKEEFTLEEIRRTGNELFPGYTISYLFKDTVHYGQ